MTATPETHEGDGMAARTEAANAKIDKALWVVREYIKDAIETSDIDDVSQVDDCTAEIPVSDLRVIEEALAGVNAIRPDTPKPTNQIQVNRAALMAEMKDLIAENERLRQVNAE